MSEKKLFNPAFTKRYRNKLMYEMVEATALAMAKASNSSSHPITRFSAEGIIFSRNRTLSPEIIGKLEVFAARLKKKLNK
jgi:hypothetical protein